MIDQKEVPLSQWIGGFAESDPDFAYPHPDLSSIPFYCNMDHIKYITRQQHVYWPEFSWDSELANKDNHNSETRCFQQFAHDVSSIGYDDTGRIWSIICPQQGFCLRDVACFNVEVTVTSQRGWVNELEKSLAADMSVVGKVWFSSSSHGIRWVKKAWDLFSRHNLPFPFNKENAIQVYTHRVGHPKEPHFTIRDGLSERFSPPDFTRHDEHSFSHGHIDVQIGDVMPTHHRIVDDFNKKIIDLFNLSTGNMLLSGNVLTWNLWFLKPEGVDQERWRTHAIRWRKSIDTGDHAHDGEDPLDINGNKFEVKHDWHYRWHELKDIAAITKDLLF